MNYKIVVDSSSNLTSDYLKDEEVGFEVVPLTIRIDNKEFIDNDALNVDEMLSSLNGAKKASSSCPSPNDFYKAYEGAEHVIVVTISSKLSGSFNSARVAKDMFDKPDNVLLIDSKLVAGAMRLLVNKAYALIKEGKDFRSICDELTSYRDSLKLLFVLDKFDNLVRNGRMNKIVAFVASLAAIKPLCYGEDGEIKIKEKIRTFSGVLKRLNIYIGKMCPNLKDRQIIISHTNNEKDALTLKAMIEQEYNFTNIIIEKNRGLCAFYSLNGGIIVSF